MAIDPETDSVVLFCRQNSTPDRGRYLRSTALFLPRQANLAISLGLTERTAIAVPLAATIDLLSAYRTVSFLTSMPATGDPYQSISVAVDAAHGLGPYALRENGIEPDQSAQQSGKALEQLIRLIGSHRLYQILEEEALPTFADALTTLRTYGVRPEFHPLMHAHAYIKHLSPKLAWEFEQFRENSAGTPAAIDWEL